MTTGTFAILYAVLAVAPIIVQLGLVLGAPWGVLTMGGRWPGKLPLQARIVASVQAVLLAGMACIVLVQAGVLGGSVPFWAFIAVGVITALSCVANIATPSRPERLLWGPVISAMLAAYLAVALL